MSLERRGINLGQNLFSLCNMIPTSINHLLFINNIYRNAYTNNRDFPQIDYDYEALLNFEEYKHLFTNVWNESFKGLEQSVISTTNNINHFDLEIHQRYSVLFAGNVKGRRLYEYSKELYLTWWWPQPYGFKNILEKISDDYIIEISTRLRAKLEKTNEVKPSGELYLILMSFTHLPEKLVADSNLLHIEPLSSFVPKVNIDQVVDRIYQNMKEN